MSLPRYFFIFFIFLSAFIHRGYAFSCDCMECECLNMGFTNSLYFGAQGGAEYFTSEGNDRLILGTNNPVDFQFNRHVSSVAGFVGGHIGANHVLENCPCMMGIEFFGNYSNLKNTSEIYGSTFKHTFKSTFWGGGKIKAGFVMGSNCCLYAFVGGAIRYMQYRVYNVNTGNVIAKSRKWLPGALYGIGYAQTIFSSNYLLSIEIERQGWHTKRFLAFDAAQNSYNNISKHEGFTVALKYSISL